MSNLRRSITQFRLLGLLGAGLAAYGYAETNNVLLLLTAAWLAGFFMSNVLALVLGKYNTPSFELYQLPLVGLVVGVFSIVAHFLIHHHWFMLAHGAFWIFFGSVFFQRFSL